MEINAEISITRNSGDNFTIEIKDQSSRNKFVKITISPTEFALLITGRTIDVECSVDSLDSVGKRKVVEKRSVQCPLYTYKTPEMEVWLSENCQEGGYTLNPALRSQGSIEYNEDGAMLNYLVYKFVEET